MYINISVKVFDDLKKVKLTLLKEGRKECQYNSKIRSIKGKTENQTSEKLKHQMFFSGKMTKVI